MAIVYSTAADSWLSKINSNWATARGDLGGAGGVHNNTHTSFVAAIVNSAVPSRGGGTDYVIYRSYFPFDLSGESGTATSATLNLYGKHFSTADTDHTTVFLIEGATALNGNVYDYGNIFTGSAGSTTLGRFIGSGVMTTTVEYQTLTLNSLGLSVLNAAIGSGTVTIGCIGYYDYNDNAPVADPSIIVRMQSAFADISGTSKDPYLDITYGAAAATDNAVFFGTNF